MTSFTVNDMTCGHCVGAITRALLEVDPRAQVSVDLDRHLVRVESAVAGAARIQAAIADAGYTPEPAPDAVTADAVAGKSGGCCGGCGGH